MKKEKVNEGLFSASKRFSDAFFDGLSKNASNRMLAKAKKQSIFQGLLSSGLSYAAQPKNQGYGSVLPYLAKAGLAGVQAAQSPYDQMGKDAMMNQQLQEMKKQQDALKARKELYTTTPSSTYNLTSMQDLTDSANTRPITGTLPDGTTAIRPNFGQQQTIQYTTPSKTIIDPQKLAEFKAEFPDEYNKMLTTKKLEADIFETEEKAKSYGMTKAEATSTYKDWVSMGGEKSSFPKFEDYIKYKDTASKAETNINMGATNQILDLGYKRLDKLTPLVETTNANIDKYTRYIDLVKNDKTLMGVGTDTKTWIGRFASIAGIGGDTVSEKLANTKEIVQTMAKRQLAAGEQLKGMPSDKEQDLLKKAGGADYENMTPAEIQRVFELAIEDEKYIQERYNSTVDKLIKAEKFNPNTTSGMIDMLGEYKITPKRNIRVDY